MTATTQIEIELGSPVDLWDGLRPCFPSAALPWRMPPQRPVRTERAVMPEAAAHWEGPSLSLHDNVAGLLSEIFDYTVSPMVGLDGPQVITAGALMHGQSLAAIEAQLKLDLTRRPAAAWLLVMFGGRRGTSYYTPEWHGLNRKARITQWLTPEGRHVLARLRLSGMRHEGSEFHGDVTAFQAQRYLAYFQAFGTHLVRSLIYGERLFQVFAVDGDRLPGVTQYFAQEGQDRLHGPVVHGLAHLTRAPWTTQASPILSASDSEAARELAHHDIWRCDAPTAPLSLLAPRAMGPGLTGLLARLPADHVVGASFASQALNLEDHRADAWSRLMRAGLCQRFPDIALSGWRRRSTVSLADFLAGAALSGDEALCRPASPVLSGLAFALDLSVACRVPAPATACLALFAITDPGSGRAADMMVDDCAFDPHRLSIPFIDGALCVTDRADARCCLVEGVWLAATEGDRRPVIAAAPAEVDPALLRRHAGRLSAYLDLMEHLQCGHVPSAVASAMRRCSAWLTEAASGSPALIALRWQALRVTRGDGKAGDPATPRVSAELLIACRAMLIMSAEDPAFAATLQAVRRRLQRFYRDVPDALDLTALDQRSRAAGAAFQRLFAGLGAAPGLSRHAAALFAAGATLCAAPDRHHLPQAIVPGDDIHAVLWNALLGLRARYAECRSIIASAQGCMPEAVALLEREIIGSRDAPPDPVSDIRASLTALGIGAAERDEVLTAVAELLSSSRSARWLHRAHNARRSDTDAIGPQLQRLLLALDVIQLCRMAQMSLPPLQSLAPAGLVDCVDQALMALADDRQSA